MMKKTLLVALVAAMLLSFPHALAATQSGSYMAGGSVKVGDTSRGLWANLCSLVDGVDDCNIGGVSLAPHPDGLLPVSVTIADNSGGPVAYTICQDLDADIVCGERDPVTGAHTEPRVEGCGTSANLAGAPVPFTATSNVVVFIALFHDACPGVGSGGTVTVHYE